MYTYQQTYIMVSLMDATAPFPTTINRLLHVNTVLSLKQLRQELSTRSRSSFFRDLKKLNLVTSFTHAGQYHALKSVPKYDANGLWFYDGAGFSEFGTLKNTLIHLISNAQAGVTHKELKRMLRINVQNTLTELVKVNTVGRQLLPHRIYLYLSVDDTVGADQVQRRLSLAESVSDIVLPPESITIEILVDVIRFPGSVINEKELGHRLRKRGIVIKDTEVGDVLSYYDIKKKRL